MYKINIDFESFEELIKKGYSLDFIYLLQKIKDNESVESNSQRVVNLVTTLERKNLVYEGKITDVGLALLESLQNSNKKIVKKTVDSSEWEKFLKAFPPRNKFVWKGKSFAGDRGIRKNTKDGEAIFKKILLNEGYTCEQLQRAVIAEAINKMDLSVLQNMNKMQYFVNTESWLRQKQYLSWIEEGSELSDKDIEEYYKAFTSRVKKSGSNTIDI